MLFKEIAPELYMTLVVTPGETALIAELTKKGVQYTTEPLLIGDAHIIKDGEVAYIFERKAKGDLDASIKDGRYHEQKARLIKSGIPRGNVVYIIEALTKPEKRTWSAISHSYHRDGFGVFQTRSTAETCDYLVAMCEAVVNHPRYSASEGSGATEAPKVNVNMKKVSVAALEFGIHTLTLIPGVSESIARVVIAEYASFRELLNAVSTDSAAVTARLSACKHGASARKIGKLAERIVEYLTAL